MASTALSFATFPLERTSRDGLTFQSVSAANRHSCGVTTAGDGYCWGENTAGQFGDGTNTDSNVPVGVDPPF